MTHPPSGPQTPPPPPGPKYCGATAVLPRLDHPKPNLPPGAPHPDAPPPGKPKVSSARLAQIGAGLVVGASLAVAGLQLMGGGG